jgi:hypothetical protein
MKKFNFTFTEKSKYNPATRTISISSENELSASRVFYSEYGNRVTIDKIEEIKEKEGEKA